jgi:intracellular sulfur oxidation DsrE/DsrF family protein
MDPPSVRATYAQMLSSGINPDGGVISLAKVDTIVQFVRERMETEPGFRCVIMCRFTAEILVIANAIGGTCIDGSITGPERQKRISAFQRGVVPHIVCQVTVAKMGIDLSMARTIIYASNSWSGDDRIQSQERCTNLMKTDPVEIIDVVTEGPGFGIDYAVALAVREKKDFNLRLLGDKK